MILQKQEKITPEFLFDNINKNPTTTEYWELIKEKIETDRSINFLQTRYRKLLRNQKLNKHENYKKYTIQELQILFPGKTKSTLLTLTKQLEDKSILNKKLVNWKTQIRKRDMKVVDILDTSNLVSTMQFKKDIFVNISPYNSFASSEHMASVPPKMLRKMQYTMNQISGEIYSKVVALKASLREDLAQGL